MLHRSNKQNFIHGNWEFGCDAAFFVVFFLRKKLVNRANFSCFVYTYPHSVFCSCTFALPKSLNFASWYQVDSHLRHLTLWLKCKLFRLLASAKKTRADFRYIVKNSYPKRFISTLKPCVIFQFFKEAASRPPHKSFISRAKRMIDIRLNFPDQ